jgi:acylphosphatase
MRNYFLKKEVKSSNIRYIYQRDGDNLIKYCRVHVFISGKVQGVYYRQNTAYKAEELNIHGWVRNLRDGCVEAVFEGEKTNIDKLLDWCNKGPKDAIVENVKIIDEQYQNEYTDFQII